MKEETNWNGISIPKHSCWIKIFEGKVNFGEELELRLEVNVIPEKEKKTVNKIPD